MPVNHSTPFAVHSFCRRCMLPLSQCFLVNVHPWLCHSSTTYLPLRSARCWVLPLLSVAVKSGAASPTLAASAVATRARMRTDRSRICESFFMFPPFINSNIMQRGLVLRHFRLYLVGTAVRQHQ